MLHGVYLSSGIEIFDGGFAKICCKRSMRKVLPEIFVNPDYFTETNSDKTLTFSSTIWIYGMCHTFFTFASTGDHLLTSILSALKGQSL